MRLAFSIVALLAATPALAGVLTCQYPKSCTDIIYASYEVGEAKSVSNHVKLTCRHGDGSVSTYIDWQFNGWCLIGLNRVGNNGTRVDFVKGSAETLACK